MLKTQGGSNATATFLTRSEPCGLYSSVVFCEFIQTRALTLKYIWTSKFLQVSADQYYVKTIKDSSSTTF